MDKYHSMKELQNETIENEDWEIMTEDRDSDVTILAIHGGGIEPATSEIGSLLMKGNLIISSLTVFEQKETMVHVTSINYDNDIAMNLVKSSERAVTIHGCLGERRCLYRW